MNEEAHNSLDCQLQVLTAGTTELTLSDKIRYIALRLGSAWDRRMIRLKRKLGLVAAQAEDESCARMQDLSESTEEATPVTGKRRRFKEGDIVRVLTLEELRPLMDEHRRTEGLTFMAGMEKYCNKRLMVKKRVRTIFDERAWKMLKIKNTYILEGAICDSRGLYDKEGCDRCCFYFWKDVWLEPTGSSSEEDLSA